MAEAVVDLFEIVEIEIEDREAPGLVEVVADGFDNLADGRAVRQAGQAICERHALERPFGLAQMTDIRNNTQKAAIALIAV